MNYYDVPAVSNSSLSYIDPMAGGSPKMFHLYMQGLLASTESASFELGTYVHQMILEPDTIDMEPTDIPGPKVKELVDQLFSMLKQEHTGLEQEISLEEFLSGMDMELMLRDFYKSRTLSSKIATLIKDGSSYWTELCLASDKTLVSPELYNKVHSCVDSIQSNPLAYDLLVGNLDGNFTEAANEMEIMWKEEWALTLDEPPTELDMKSKLDRVLINDEEKTLVLVDLKTTSSPLGRFQESFEKYNYHRQMAFYQFALSRAYPGYTLKNVYIIAVQTNKYFPCEVFQVHDSYLDSGWHDLCTLMNRICFHMQIGNWSQSQEALLGGAHLLKIEDDEIV